MKETLVQSLVQEETNAEEQLSPGTSTTEPTHCNKGSWCTQTLYSTREATSVRNPHTNEEQPHSLQLEKDHVQQQDPVEPGKK